MPIVERGYDGCANGDGQDTLTEVLARGDAQEIECQLRNDLETSPGSAVAMRNLGVFLGARGQWEESAGLLGKAAHLDPADATIPGDYAHALWQGGKAEEAVRVLQKALRRWPEEAPLRLRLAKLLAKRGEIEAAVEQCNLCRSIPQALRVKGYILAKASLYHRAREVWTELFTMVEPTREDWVTMAAFEWHSGNASASVEIARRVREEGPVPSFFASTEITGRLHIQNENPKSLRAAIEEWNATYPPSKAVAPMTRRKRRRRLRIGFLTQEFHAGPAIHFILPLLEQRDRARFEIAGYYCGRANDQWTRRARRHVDAWRHMDDTDLLRRTMKQDALDVLVDLSGHYGTHLPLFQERHAPLQITIPNCPCSTGAREVDYILSDRWVCPEGSEHQYTEQPYWLPSGYLAYRPPARMKVSQGPIEEKGYVTFGFFQRPTKLNDRVWDAFAAILREVKNSRLLMQHACADLKDPRSIACQSFREELASRGVDPRRVEFQGPLPLEEHLQLAGGVDIALDSFPYNGQTTTCECLWMGVPVVTLAGEMHVARVGWQLLDRIGCPELTAFTETDYVRLAVELAQDRGRLREYRKRLRPRFRASALVNGSVVRDIEDAFERLEKR